MPKRIRLSVNDYTLAINLRWRLFGWGFGCFPDMAIDIFECGPIDFEWPRRGVTR